MNKISLIVCLFFAFISNIAQAQSIQSPYYIVVGGFAIQQNAIRFTEHLQKLKYPAQYSFNPEKNLYYVYVQVAENLQVARQHVQKLRTEQMFKSAWIYNGGFTTELKPEGIVKTEVKESLAQPSPEEKTPIVEQAAVAQSSTPVEEPVASGPHVEADAPVGKPFIFQLTNDVTNKPVIGSVRIMESENDTLYQRYQANELVYIPAPKNGRMVVVCDLVGFKSMKRAILYNSPTKNVGVSIGSSDEIVVPFKLAGVKRGDYIELEHVKFYDHSAILKPESEVELQELVNLMSTPDYKIRLHGHTHNDGSHEIITLGDSYKYFTLDPSNKTIHGSAKELSKYRAEIIKDYLISKGISSNRIATQGHGALLAIYQHAAANERVEVEILKH
jgi:outer membrane protein OmpA-like peptidoglycan-associated protein